MGFAQESDHPYFGNLGGTGDDWMIEVFVRA
jgi:hypothetical protein